MSCRSNLWLRFESIVLSRSIRSRPKSRSHSRISQLIFDLRLLSSVFFLLPSVFCPLTSHCLLLTPYSLPYHHCHRMLESCANQIQHRHGIKTQQNDNQGQGVRVKISRRLISGSSAHFCSGAPETCAAWSRENRRQ